MTDLDAELDRLYAADLEAFVAERAELVRTLKRDGRKAEAAQVQELRKPSLAVWTVNRLVRVKRKDVERLLAAGESLEAAQTALVRGGDQAAFAAARDREQKALRQLRQAAGAVLGCPGVRGNARPSRLDATGSRGDGGGSRGTRTRSSDGRDRALRIRRARRARARGRADERSDRHAHTVERGRAQGAPGSDRRCENEGQGGA